MTVHPEELELAREYSGSRAFEDLNAEQMRLIMNRGRDFHRWFKAHPGIHAAISLGVIAGILATDWLGWTSLARWIISHGSTGAVILAGVFTGVAHSWLSYSLEIYSLHEGAAHNLIFPGTGTLSRAGSYLAANLSRLGAAEPGYYSACHMAHHAKFGTEHDSEFLNFIFPGRFWRTWLPLAAFINYSDFLIHRPLSYTRARVMSGLIAAVYQGLYVFMLYRLFGGLFAIIAVLLLPHVGFQVDRLRQFTEHNLMPLENKNGARSFGLGFWGLLVGGGPWGQPCHLAHHLVPSIPWYQQIRLHRYMVGLLTEKQREQFLVKPVIGYPRLLWRVVREANRFWRKPGSRFAEGNELSS